MCHNVCMGLVTTLTVARSTPVDIVKKRLAGVIPMEKVQLSHHCRPLEGVVGDLGDGPTYVLQLLPRVLGGAPDKA